MDKQIKYHEIEMKFEGDPLDFIVRLANLSAPNRSYYIYERDKEWSLAIDSVVEIMVGSKQIKYEDPFKNTVFPIDQLVKKLPEVISSIPISDWRIYGTANFEFTRIIERRNKNHIESAEDALLHLTVPKVEIRVKGGCVLVRATTREDAEKYEEIIANADHLMETGNKRCSDLDALDVSIGSEEDKFVYKKIVSGAIEDIKQGKYTKVILSRKVAVSAEIDMLASFVRGRRSNNPARSFVIHRENYMAIGFSPETILEVSAIGAVSTQPLAGTRAVGANSIDTDRLRVELLTNIKEIAEHAMSVKLACEEMSGICEADSVAVTEFMNVIPRGAVQHLASRVVGRLGGGRSCWDAFFALFPAITASGIPKAEAINAIGKYEEKVRGLYSGSVLTLSEDGAMDAALVLRALYRDVEGTWLQAGAGIVGDSIPEREYEETCEKLSCVSSNLVLAITEGVDYLQPALINVGDF